MEEQLHYPSKTCSKMVVSGLLAFTLTCPSGYHYFERYLPFIPLFLAEKLNLHHLKISWFCPCSSFNYLRILRKQ